MRGKLPACINCGIALRITPAGAGKTIAVAQQGHRFKGITPAGAGKTVTYLHDVESAKDHPRRCGENRKRNNYAEISKGSPPQVRGKRRVARPLRARFGITPAGAGKTYPVCDRRVVHGDHPRRCGENIAAMLRKR